MNQRIHASPEVLIRATTILHKPSQHRTISSRMLILEVQTVTGIWYYGSRSATPTLSAASHLWRGLQHTYRNIERLRFQKTIHRCSGNTLIPRRSIQTIPPAKRYITFSSNNMHRPREQIRRSAHSARSKELARGHGFSAGEIVCQYCRVELAGCEEFYLRCLDCGGGDVAVWVGEGGNGVCVDVVAAEDELGLVGAVLGEALEG